MATVYGKNFGNAYNAKPAVNYPPGEFNGLPHVIYDEYTLLADAGNGDIVKMGRLPKGARIIGAKVIGPDLGGTGTLNLGHTTDGVLSAQAAGFISGADSSGQAFAVSGAGVSLGQKLSAEVDIELTFVGVTASATGKKVQTIVEYILD
jgi:hypothetical protein